MAAEAAVGASAGLFLFGYNRGNYMYDASFRYERFTTGREFAIQQMEQYRGDLKKLSELTMKRGKLYADSAALALALCIALYCAGRLGLHGPSPPAWIIGLWYTNNAASFAFMIVTIWLGTHAAARAAAASCHLLTRRARVPVPTLRQLDKARKFASEFEQQDFADMLRVPYISNNGAPKTDDAARETADHRAWARSGSAPPSSQDRSNASSSWIREEFETDKAGTVIGPMPRREDTVPEHFQHYEAVQKYWYQYDIYARITLSYGFLSLFHGFAYYGLGHINIELRAFWVPYGVAFVLMVLHACIIKFDIVQGNKKGEWLPYCQWLGPLAPLPAAIAMSLDFRVQFELHAVIITWVLIFISYAMQFIYTCRLLVCVIPDDFLQSEQIGGSWWPETWKVPSTFRHVLYLVTPPRYLQPGQHDTVREIKDGPMVADAGNDDDPPEVLSPEDLKARMDYVNRLFEWVFLDEVYLRMSKPGKERVQELHGKFRNMQVPNIITGSAEDNLSLAKTLKQLMNGVEAVTSREGVGYLDSSGAAGSGSDSSSPEDSGNKGPNKKGGSGIDGTEYKTPLHQFQKSPFNQTEHIQPWKLVALLTSALLAGWIFMICGVVIDVILGEQALVTAPHWSRPPLTRLSLEPHELGTPLGGPTYAGSAPWTPEQMAWHEEKREATLDTLGRRLATPTKNGQSVASVAVSNAKVSAAYKSLLNMLPQAIAPAKVPSKNEITKHISWPGFFEPQILACGPATLNGDGIITALTPRGFGATAHINHFDQKTTAADAFKLAGISNLPPLLGASWGPMAVSESQAVGHGLWLLSRGGHVVTCPGPQPSAGGTWYCTPPPASIPSRLPVALGSKLVTAATAWLPDPSTIGGPMRLHTALIDASAPDVVALFVLETVDGRSSWSPLGEMLVPDRVSKVSIAFIDGGDLVVTTEAGVMVRRSLHDGAMIGSTTRPWGSTGSIERRKSWRSTCAFPHGVAHLHLRQRLPEIVTGDLPTLGPNERHVTTLPPLYQ